MKDDTGEVVAGTLECQEHTFNEIFWDERKYEVVQFEPDEKERLQSLVVNLFGTTLTDRQTRERFKTIRDQVVRINAMVFDPLPTILKIVSPGNKFRSSEEGYIFLGKDSRAIFLPGWREPGQMIYGGVVQEGDSTEFKPSYIFSFGGGQMEFERYGASTW